MPATDPSGTKLNSAGANPYERYFIQVILLITALTYLPTLKFDFVYDDYPQILSNPFVKSWRYVPGYFTSSVWKQMFPLAPGNYYRPLFLLWTRINYSLFAESAIGWHGAAVVLHVLVTWMVYRLVKKLTGRFTLAWLTALIFGVHPIHHEVVAWVSAATESLFAILFLSAFMAYLQAEKNSKAIWMTVSCALYALALLCKETAIVLPALVFTHCLAADAPGQPSETYGFGQRLRRAASVASLYVPIALIYLYVRNRVLSGFSHPLVNVSFWTWLLTVPSGVLFYIKNWFFPIRLSEDYDFNFQTHLNLVHVILPALILIAISGAIWFFRDKLGPRDAGYAAAWILIPLLPVLDFVVFKSGELVHDRYFYLPSIGAALLVALCIDWGARNSRRVVFGQSWATMVVALVLALGLATCTIRTTAYWMDGYTLFTRAHEIAPENSTAANNLGVELIERKEFDKAETVLEPAYQRNPGDFRLSLNLGRVQYVKNQYAKAEEYTRQSIALGPDVAEPYVYLGMIQLKENHPREAQATLSRAVQLNPWDAHFHTIYGIILASNGDCTDAMSQFNAALALSPGDALTQVQMFRCRAALAVVPTSSVHPGQP